jgi:hypothetical protein
MVPSLSDLTVTHLSSASEARAGIIRLAHLVSQTNGPHIIRSFDARV